jgi:hypothetical protein
LEHDDSDGKTKDGISWLLAGSSRRGDSWNWRAQAGELDGGDRPVKWNASVSLPICNDVYVIPNGFAAPRCAACDAMETDISRYCLGAAGEPVQP